MKKAKINKIIKFSSVDGPGNRMSIFFQGCNYNCLYCHNPETINMCNSCGECVDGCPKGALSIVDSKVFWDRKKCIECDRCTEVCMIDSTPKTMAYSVEELLMEIKKVSGFIRGTLCGFPCEIFFELFCECVCAIPCELVCAFVSDSSWDCCVCVYSPAIFLK